MRAGARARRERERRCVFQPRLPALSPQLKRALNASLGSGLEPDAAQKNDGAKKSEGGKKTSDSTSGVKAGVRAPKQADGGASAGAKKGKAGGRLPLKHTDSRPSERRRVRVEA